MATWCSTGLEKHQSQFTSPQNRRSYKRVPEVFKKLVTYAWTQKQNAISIQIQLGDQVLREEGALFCKNYIQIEFRDGGMWKIKLFRPVKPNTARTKVQDEMVHLYVEKEVSERWDELEDTSQEVAEASEEGENAAAEDEGAMEGAPKETKVGTAKEKTVEKDNTENKENEMLTEDAVIPVGNVLVQAYDNKKIRTVTLYVKKVKKGSAKVSLEKDRFSLKFQTSDKSFLKDYEGATEDTFFGWHSEVMEELDVQKCGFCISPSNVQIRLGRADGKNWSDSSGTSKKEAPQSQSDSSILTSKGQADPSQVRVAWSATSSPRSCIMQPKPPRFNVSEVSFSKAASTRGQGDGAQAEELGRVGLVNSNQNCYLNVVIQTLAHLPHLRDYLIDPNFQKDLNRRTNQSLALAFAACIRRLWNGNRTSFSPRILLDKLRERSRIFEIDRVTLQQDAHEVMGLVLDGLHEDLKKEPTSTDHLPALEDGPAEAMGQRAWEICKAKDDSKVMDAVRGLYKSVVVCMTCQKESCSFDPFTSHPLPIPKRCYLRHITFLWRDPRRRPVKYALPLPQCCTLSDVKAAISYRTRVKPNRMRVFKTLNGKVDHTFSNDDEVISLHSGSLMVCEVLTKADAGEKVWEITVMQRRIPPGEILRCHNCNKERKAGGHLWRCQGCRRAAYCNGICQHNHWHKHKAMCSNMVGSPFIISLPESKATYSNLIYFLKGCARYSVTVTQLRSDEKPSNGTAAAESGEKGRQGSISPQLTTHSSLSNLSSSSSQSSGSLNSLDSQSSGNSTSTLTADVQQEADVEDMDAQSGLGNSRDSVELDSCYSSLTSNGGLSAHFQKSSASNLLQTGELTPGFLQSDGADSGCPAEDDIEDELPNGFYMKPVTEQGISIKGAPRLEDKGDESLDFSASPYFAMDWRVIYNVETKELETYFDGDRNAKDGTMCPVTLEQCLHAFMDNEYLEGSNGWHCPQCKKPQRAAKHLSLWKLPPVLIISLKRFNKNNYGHALKDDTYVHFPINNLDLSSACSGEGNRDGLIYDLYAVVNHLGGLSLGHYHAYIRCNEDFTPGSDPEWMSFNDEVVRPMREVDVVSEAAYILIYRQRPPSAQTQAQEPSQAQAQAPAQPIPDGLGDNKAAEAAASVAPAVDHRARTEAWAARPQRNGLEDQKENVDEEMTAPRGVEDEDDEDDAFEDPVGSPEKWAQTVNRPASPQEEEEEEEKMDDAKETMEVDDLDARYESNLNNSCPEPDGAQVENEAYTDMDSLD